MDILSPPARASQFNREGVASARPSASQALKGVLWHSTDTGEVSRCDGTQWLTIVPPSGTSAPQGAGFIDFTQGQRRADYLPTFTKDASNPKFQTANLVNLSSIEFPCLVRVDTIFGGPGPYGESYRCYYSTDHEGTTAGIGLFTFSSWSGAWTDHGVIFRDASGGNQCENPAVIWVPETQTFHLYYHMVGATGSTSSEAIKLATMPLATALTGDVWTPTTAVANGLVLDSPNNGGWPGNGGWGYMKPFRIGQRWYAHYRVGGAADLAFAIAKSNDGIHWSQDPRLLFYAADKMHDIQGRWNPSSHFPDWGSGTVLQWHGRLWWIGVLLAYQVQYQSPQFAWAVIAPLSADMRKFTAPPTPIFSTNQTWEGAVTGQAPGCGNHRYGMSAIVDTDGLIHLAYVDGSVNKNNDAAQAANFAAGIGLAVGR